MAQGLKEKVALVAGATRGAGRGIAVQLGAAGAIVYVTGRTTRFARSEMNRPETIEETAVLVDDAGGRGIAVQVDHLVPDEVRALAARIEAEQGRLHVLVNDIWGTTTMEWKNRPGNPLWIDASRLYGCCGSSQACRCALKKRPDSVTASLVEKNNKRFSHSSGCGVLVGVWRDIT